MSGQVVQFVGTLTVPKDKACRMRLGSDVSGLVFRMLREEFPEFDVSVVDKGLRYDQYGEMIPADIVPLPDPADMMDVECESAARCDWWEVWYVGKVVCLVASLKSLVTADVPVGDHADVDWCSLAPDADEGDFTFVKVDQGLKRWSTKDGFYHA